MFLLIVFLPHYLYFRTSLRTEINSWMGSGWGYSGSIGDFNETRSVSVELMNDVFNLSCCKLLCLFVYLLLLSVFFYFYISRVVSI